MFLVALLNAAIILPPGMETEFEKPVPAVKSFNPLLHIYTQISVFRDKHKLVFVPAVRDRTVVQMQVLDSATLVMQKDDSISLNIWYTGTDGLNHDLVVYQSPDGKVRSVFTIKDFALTEKAQISTYEEADFGTLIDKHPDIKKELVPFFKHLGVEDALCSRHFAEYIGNIGAFRPSLEVVKSCDMLLPHLDHDSWKVRDAATEGLVALGDDGALYLHQLLRKEGHVWSAEKRARVESVLGRYPEVK